MIDTVEITHSNSLVRALDALAIPWAEGLPSNGAEAIILVEIDTATDGLLEDIIGALSEIRWKYEPGRQLQLALEMPGV